MSFAADAFHWILIALIVANAAAILLYIAATKARTRRARRDTEAVTAAIVDYFRKTGVQVAARCIGPDRKNRYTVMIESEPMKRFRLSHIIELTLRDQVRKTCALELDKIYWRFPIREAAKDAAGQGTAAGDNRTGQQADEYINEGLEHYRYIPKVEATELPWEDFEQVSTIGGEGKTDAAPER